MKGLHWGWYLLIGLVALAPAGVRVLTWPGFHRAAVNPAMAQAGQTLFLHEWKPNDPLSAGGDGLGPVYNATSCVACHHQVRPGGGGGLEHNVTTFVIRDAQKARRRRPLAGRQVPRDLESGRSAVAGHLPADAGHVIAAVRQRQEPHPLSLARQPVAAQHARPVRRRPDRRHPRPRPHRQRAERAVEVGAGLVQERRPAGRPRRAPGRWPRRPFRLEGTERQSVVFRTGCVRQRTGTRQPRSGPTSAARPARLSGGRPRPDRRAVRSDHVLRRLAAAADRTPARRQLRPRARVGRQTAVRACRLRRLPYAERRQGRGVVQRPAPARHGPAVGGRRLVQRSAAVEPGRHAQGRSQSRRMANAAVVGRGRLRSLPARRPGIDAGSSDRTARRPGRTVGAQFRRPQRRREAQLIEFLKTLRRRERSFSRDAQRSAGVSALAARRG